MDGGMNEGSSSSSSEDSSSEVNRNGETKSPCDVRFQIQGFALWEESEIVGDGIILNDPTSWILFLACSLVKCGRKGRTEGGK